MRWVEISKAKIEFNAPVFTKDKNGVFGLGKLISKVERFTKEGKVLVHEFEMAAFEEGEPNYSDDITHVANPSYDNKKKKGNPAAKITEAG